MRVATLLRVHDQGRVIGAEVAPPDPPLVMLLGRDRLDKTDGRRIGGEDAAPGEAGLWAENEGYEYALVLSVVVAGLAAIGPGAVSLDAALGWRLDGLGWGLGAVALGVVAAGAILSTRRPTCAPAAGEQH